MSSAAAMAATAAPNGDAAAASKAKASPVRILQCQPTTADGDLRNRTVQQNSIPATNATVANSDHQELATLSPTAGDRMTAPQQAQQLNSGPTAALATNPVSALYGLSSAPQTHPHKHSSALPLVVGGPQI